MPADGACPFGARNWPLLITCVGGGTAVGLPDAGGARRTTAGAGPVCALPAGAVPAFCFVVGGVIAAGLPCSGGDPATGAGWGAGALAAGCPAGFGLPGVSGVACFSGAEGPDLPRGYCGAGGGVV